MVKPAAVQSNVQRTSRLRDGKVALTVTVARPLSATDFVSIGGAVEQIENPVAGLTGSDTCA